MKPNAESLLKNYEDYHAQFPADRLTNYIAPCCNKELKALKPTAASHPPFSSAVKCPHCQGLHFKVVYHDGQVQAVKMQ